MTCDIGGGVTRGHNKIRDWLAELMTRWTGEIALTEQHVPKWDRVERDRQGRVKRDEKGEPIWKKARLDVQFQDVKGLLTYADVVVTAAMSTDAGKIAQYAATPGQAAADAEAGKRSRYRPEDNPRAALVPFAVESLGRPGPAAVHLLRAMAPTDVARRGVELQRAWRELSVLVQVRRADLLLHAARTA